MARARIYRPSKNAMQSGKMHTKKWVLSFKPQKGYSLDALMGWNSSSDMRQQVHLSFDTLEEAEDYARAKDLEYDVIVPPGKSAPVKAYTQNFAYNRKQPWTH